MNIDLNELELDDISAWPVPVRVFTIFIICLAILFLGYWFDTKKQIAQLDQYKKEEIDLKNTFETKQHKAANLQAYQAQMATMKESFGALLRQLPERSEVPGLLEDISHQGLATGLEFKTIRLLPEKQIDFYVELPIEIAVIGNYHQLAEFVSNVASLPRIVTLHDFTIRSHTDKHNHDQLIMNITAKTYRYMSEGEQLIGQPPGPAGGAS